MKCTVTKVVFICCWQCGVKKNNAGPLMYYQLLTNGTLCSLWVNDAFQVYCVTLTVVVICLSTKYCILHVHYNISHV